MLDPPLGHMDENAAESLHDLHLDQTESIYLVGGYDGESWLSTLDSYFPFEDVIKSFKPMKSVRSYASVAWLNSELYVFGGGDGSMWYNTGINIRFLRSVIGLQTVADVSVIFLKLNHIAQEMINGPHALL